MIAKKKSVTVDTGTAPDEEIWLTILILLLFIIIIINYSNAQLSSPQQFGIIKNQIVQMDKSW